jgi:hypothetical protein
LAKATLDAPDTAQVAVELQVGGWDTSVDGKSVTVRLKLLGASGAHLATLKEVVRSEDVDGNPTFAALIDFYDTITQVRAGESGGAENRINYRVLGYLIDQGLLSGVTLEA